MDLCGGGCISGSAWTLAASAELNSLLSGFTRSELREAVGVAPPVTLTPFLANYIAAMVEYGCEKRALPV
jgi:hypothetical protein